jgi:hypothetical protein
MAKHYRHQDTKAQKGLLTNGIPSCLCAFVATFPACPGWAFVIHLYFNHF